MLSPHSFMVMGRHFHSPFLILQTFWSAIQSSTNLILFTYKFIQHIFYALKNFIYFHFELLINLRCTLFILDCGRKLWQIHTITRRTRKLHSVRLQCWSQQQLQISAEKIKTFYGISFIRFLEQYIYVDKRVKRVLTKLILIALTQYW